MGASSNAPPGAPAVPPSLCAPGYDLAATLGSGQAFHWAEDGEGGFVGTIGDHPCRLTPAADGQILIGGSAPIEKVRSYLGLALPPDDILRSFPSDDPALAEAIAYCPGLRILRQPPWECLATFITSSLKQVAHIRSMSLELRRRFGEGVKIGDSELFAYPTPAAIAEAGEGELRKCGLGYRARGLHRAASQIAAGKVDLGALEELGDEDLRDALCEFYGVGEKIADCVSLFAYGRGAAFPVDVWVDRAVRQLYFPRRRKPLRPADIRAFAHKHFGPYAGHAQQFLFHWSRVGKGLEDKE